jgi:hypothetical protein
MTTPTEPEGDYGYDLVHEEVRGPRTAPPGAEAIPDPRPERRTERLGNVVSGDYSYDQAHGF